MLTEPYLGGAEIIAYQVEMDDGLGTGFVTIATTVSSFVLLSSLAENSDYQYPLKRGAMY